MKAAVLSMFSTSFCAVPAFMRVEPAITSGPTSGEIAIAPLVGAEVIAGSTRMKAGTAQKLVLNMISTTTFIRLGYVYGNLMVNVQPRNHKLVERARRIIAQAAELPYERAAELLEASGNSVRTAIVMARAGVDREEARRRLNASGGRIAQAILS